MLAILAAVAISGVAALPSSGLNSGLAANLAYRSPSLNIRELEIVPRHPHNKRWTDGSDNPTYTGNLSFPFGVASGDPYSDSVILTTHPEKVDLQGLYGGNAYPPICLDWVVSKNENDFSNSSRVQNGRVHTTQDVRFAVKVEATGLEPYTQYYYRFESCVGDESLGVSPVGAFKTLPGPDQDVGQLRLAVFSCSNLPFGFFNAYGHAANTSAERQLDYVQHVGDAVYEYANGAYGDGTALNRVPLPLRECSSLEDYRDRYASYRLLDPDLRELHRLVAWQTVWDDHEVADNTWKFGSADSNDTIQGQVGDYEFSARKANAVRAYFEWMPIRQQVTDGHLRVYRTFELGKLGTMIMLDTRQEDRSETDLYYQTARIEAQAGDSNRTMTGAKQQDWLFEQMAAHKARNATWPLLFQQVVFAEVNYTLASGGSTEFNVDAWSGYRYQRDQILKHVEETQLDNLVILSGDSHASWVSDLTRENSTYNATTGAGALGVEFAGSAVSSPSSYGYGPTWTDERYRGVAANLTAATPALQYAEGQLRGYFQLLVTPSNVTADFFGFYDQQTRNGANATLMGSFVTEAGSNKLSRPINGGKALQFGAYGAGGAV